MGEIPKAPPIFSPNHPLSAAPSPSSSLPESPGPSPPKDQISEHDGVYDSGGTLDAQYVDVLDRLQQLIRGTRDLRNQNTRDQHIPPKGNEIYYSLETCIVDLRVWANDLSDDDDFFLKSLESLAWRNQALSARLQRILCDIQRLLTSIEEKMNEVEDGSRTSDFEWILHQCNLIHEPVGRLKALKSSLKKDLATKKPSSSQHASILCVDGGGIKSYASLLILGELMDLVGVEMSREQSRALPKKSSIRPCDVFGFMYGSSSGGLIAIMLGRLEMTVEESIKTFRNYADTIFSHPRPSSRLFRGLSASKYSERRLIQAARLIVNEFDPSPEDEKWRRNIFGVRSGLCKTGVLATDISRNVPEAYMFRTYDCEPKSAEYIPKRMPTNPSRASSMLIWQVTLATSAAPLLFPPIRIEDRDFVDGGMIANNPSQLALREVAFLRRDKLTGICLVSIGSGIFQEKHLYARALQSKGFFIKNWKRTIQTLQEIATQTEATHTSVRETSLDHEFPYFRFNPEFDREIPSDEWVKQRDASGTHLKTLDDIEQLTRSYLQTEEVRAQLRECASAVVSCTLRAAKESCPL